MLYVIAAVAIICSLANAVLIGCGLSSILWLSAMASFLAALAGGFLLGSTLMKDRIMGHPHG